jgi:hypothetical protein
MRIRSIKPEFWRSDDITALSISARLTFVGTWSYVDDNGVGSAKLSSIVADLYAEDMARDPQETLRRVSGDLRELADRGLVLFYEAAGKQLLYVTRWTAHQLVNKPSKGHCYPLPPAEMIKAAETLTTPSGDSQESSQDGTGEQGSRGTGEQGKEADASSSSANEIRDDVERLCEYLADWIVKNGSKRPTIGKKWHDAARLMLDRDGRTEEQVHKAIDWCQNDEFWRKNIMSMPKLREQFDRLRLAAQSRPSNVVAIRGDRMSEKHAMLQRSMERAQALDALEEGSA